MLQNKYLSAGCCLLKAPEACFWQPVRAPEPGKRGLTHAMAITKRKPKTIRDQQDSEPQIAPEEMLKLYRDMLLIRRFEEKAGQMYGMGLIGGFCHLYIGQVPIART